MSSKPEEPKKDDPKPPAPEAPKPPAEPDVLDVILDDLKTMNPQLDLSFLSKKEQVKAYLALKKATPPPAAPPAAPTPPSTTPIPVQNPAVPPAIPDDPKIIPFAERNAVGGKWWQENIADKTGVRLYHGKE